jgi:hypothetical protein
MARLALAVGQPSGDTGVDTSDISGRAQRWWEVVVEAGSVAGSARQRWGRHRLVGQWINGVGSGDVRVRVLGCQGGAALTSLEGAWERRAARDGQG